MKGRQPPGFESRRGVSSRQHGGLEEVLAKFVANHGLTAGAAAFGIAGPVRNGVCETPNLPWVVNSKSVAAFLGLQSVSLLNDLEANAHGIAVLDDSDFATLSVGLPGRLATRC